MCWLNCQAQRVMTSSMITEGHRCCTLRSVFTNGLDNATGCMPSYFAGNTNLGKSLILLFGCTVIQRDRAAEKHLIEFKGKCKILHPGRTRSLPWYTLGASQLESRSAEPWDPSGKHAEGKPASHPCKEGKQHP